MDIFERIKKQPGPLGQYSQYAHGYFAFPKLEGEISNYMFFRGKKVLVWSLNNYLGFANHPEVRKADAEACEKWGLAYPMGARMMSGETSYHEQLERELADFEQKDDAFLLNYGYQGMFSIIDAMVTRNDAIVYDSESHACIVDGCRLHMGKRFVFQHNDMQSLEKQLEHATQHVSKTNGGILVITEGVYGMAGDLGKLDKIIELKKKYNFRFLVDDAHGFGTMGKNGSGTGEALNCQEKIDLYFATFAKALAGIGAFVTGDGDIIKYLKYNLRSQIFAKSLPLPMTQGALKRLELLRSRPELLQNLWKIVYALQDGLKKVGFNLGQTQSPVTPVYLEGNEAEAANLVIDLRKNYEIFCSVVIYPVVPKDVIMLRLIPTAVHTLDDVKKTIQAFTEVKKKLDSKQYIQTLDEVINLRN